ncbi:MAG: transcriptional regulator, DeoR family [Caloramator sp.]|jgi:DeoR family fructose operon transcriptional repressor|uniref:DeoR/GlpR family DNA-binding transcription regulator n=1 Tax=Caloramator sp. TaxID=1871330 RepID=UPI001D1FFEC3|nr:DeoR/GlpR family DNA-binding transcription regulator [Caloramator sp.]MBZ4663455.1 transcriptional regulator, DeoR family [Caloramator sp.]
MFAEERKAKILEMINSGNSVRVSELSRLFNVSEATIRRDLIELEQAGCIVRTHGGAVSNTSTNFEPSFKEKQDKFLKEKEQIAKKAASLIEDGDTVTIDSGTTTQFISKYLNAKGVTVVTNSVNLADELSDREDVEVIVTGGLLRTKTKAMVGPVAEETLKKLKVDKLFLGANGISIKSGVTTPNIVEANTKRVMIEGAKEVFLLIDSSKFDEVNFSLICPVSKIDYIVTDKLPKDYEKYEHLGIKFILI